MRKRRTAPWRKPNPRKGHSRKLSPKQREAARGRAARAGRTYPNLVDNMWVATRGRTKSAKAKRVGRKSSTKTAARKRRRKSG